MGCTALATLVVVLLPLQAAPASAGNLGCSAVPQTPFMIDPQIYEVDGPSETSCVNTMDLVQAQAELDVAISGTWTNRGEGAQNAYHTTFVWADGFTSCKGENFQSFMTRGWATFSAGAAGGTDGWNKSGWTSLNCGSLPDPKDGANGVKNWIIGG